MSDKQQSDFDSCADYFQYEIDLEKTRQLLSGDPKGRGEKQNAAKFWINQKLERFNLEL